MLPRLAKCYVVLSGFILMVVGITGFFRYEMFGLSFPPTHNVFPLLSGIFAPLASFRGRPLSPRRFCLIFGWLYLFVALAGFSGLHDLPGVRLGLNLNFNVIHLGIGVLSLLAGWALPGK